MKRFCSKVVIVTGASSGIGAATAIAFAKEGARLAICGRNIERLGETSNICKEHGAEVLEIAEDLSEFSNIENIINKTIEKYSAIDVLINNAGRTLRGPIAELEVKDFESLYRTNLRAPVFLCKYALPHLKETKECAPFGVRVNNINPGFVDTGILERQNIPKEVVDKCIADFEKTHILGIMKPDTIADGILFLCSSPHITGITLPIDSGSLNA
ncbi:putative oxidoreductase TM_0325 isoform X2 [Styela clava]